MVLGEVDSRGTFLKRLSTKEDTLVRNVERAFSRGSAAALFEQA